MRAKRVAACSFVLVAASIYAQQSPSTGLNSGPVSHEGGTVYDVGGDIAPPLLLVSRPIAISSGRCKRKNQDANDVRFSLIVDAEGKARRITFLHALGNNLDQTALELVQSDRFTPAQRDGRSVAVWQSVDVVFESCREDPKDKTKFPNFAMISQPTQTPAPLEDHPQGTPDFNGAGHPAQLYRVGGSVYAPVPLNTPEARYSNEARKKKIQGVCLISLIVDANGMPQNPRVTRPVGYGLDENALEAVKLYRFKPARRNGIDPVPVQMMIEVNFRLY